MPSPWRGRRPSSTASSTSRSRGRRRELPERERTKHVHRLHPYLGKFVPQLVEALLERYVRPGGRVLDPFAGSGTTLVQALESGYDAVGVDVAAFNALLMRGEDRATTTLARSSRRFATLARGLGRSRAKPHGFVRGVVRAARPRRSCSHFRSLIDRATRTPDVLRDRARPRGALGAADDPLRPRLSARAAGRGVLVPQAPPHVPAGREREQVPLALPRSTRAARIRRFADVRDRSGRRSSSTATRASSSSAGRTTASSRRRPTRA